MAATQAFAANNKEMGSISPAYEFVDHRADKARTEQHRADHDVEQVLNASHALVALDKCLLYRGIAFTAHRNMNGVIFFDLAHFGYLAFTARQAAMYASICA